MPSYAYGKTTQYQPGGRGTLQANAAYQQWANSQAAKTPVWNGQTPARGRPQLPPSQDLSPTPPPNLPAGGGLMGALGLSGEGTSATGGVAGQGSPLNLNGFSGPPTPPNPYIASSIPLEYFQSQFLPEEVIRTGINQQFSKHQQEANPEPILNQYGANQNNMASAASGQYTPMMLAQMQDPLQEAALAQGEGPLAARMRHHDLAGKGLTAQSKEVLDLANISQDWYRDRLRNWETQWGQRLNMTNAFSDAFNRMMPSGR